MTDPVADRRWMQDRPTRERADPTGALGGRVTIFFVTRACPAR